MEKVSIIMGIYNTADTLDKAVESILNQTYKNWELIMCDDGSVDNTYDLAKKYADQYPEKIKLIRNDRNRKLSYTLNHCLQYASGKYVARMDADDISVADRIEKEVAFLQTHPEYQLVGTLMQRFSDSGLADVVALNATPDKYALTKGTPFNHATILTYKNVYDDLGGYSTEARAERCEDYDLWFRFFQKGYSGYNIQEALYLVKEDIGAIKRRTVKSRLYFLKTTKVGYKLLGFPRSWYFKTAIKTYIKCLIPPRLMLKYRERQVRRYQIRNKT